MHVIYVVDNFINENCLLYVLSEDDLYVRENLYNERPSLPYRTMGVGAAGAPEYVCVDLGTYSGVEHGITFAALFNHNISTSLVAPDELVVKGCDDLCAGSGACDWDIPDAEVDLTTLPSSFCPPACSGTQPVAGFKNLYRRFTEESHRYWQLEIIDRNNEDGYIEIGEWVLSQWQELHRGAVTGHTDWARLSPGRPDGPMFFMGTQATHYGQDWTNYRSDAEAFTLTFTNINDPCQVDQIQAFLQDVQRAGGTFIIVPDDEKPWCYYVLITNAKEFAQRLVYGRAREYREWRLELKTLTQGIRLI